MSIVLSGGTEIVSSGSTISNSTVSSGGVVEVFGGANVNNNNTILAGGTLEIGSGYTIGEFAVNSVASRWMFCLAVRQSV